MHILSLVLAGLPLAVASAFEIPQRPGKIRSAYEESIHHLMENEGVHSRFALPDLTGRNGREEPKRTQPEPFTTSTYAANAHYY